MRRIFVPLLVLAISAPVFAGSLSTNTRAVIPADVQQVINVDYRRLKDSQTGMALKERVLPPGLKSFEVALRGLGLNPEEDVEQITFASFRVPGKGVRVVGIAQGEIEAKKMRATFKKKKITAKKVRGSSIYPMTGAMVMTFLDDNTLLFGESSAVNAALDARDGSGTSLNNNPSITNLIAGVEDGTVWSVLDAQGTQTMMRSALGEAAGLADYETVKKRLLGSRYIMDFNNGVDFQLNVQTSDTFTAATLSSLIQAGMKFKQMRAKGAEKMALDSLEVDSDSGKLNVKFRSDDKRFQSLLESELFMAVAK